MLSLAVNRCVIFNRFDDIITSSDWRGVKYVDAYLNPFTLEWNRLMEGQEPPTPEELQLVRYLITYNGSNIYLCVTVSSTVNDMDRWLLIVMFIHHKN